MIMKLMRSPLKQLKLGSEVEEDNNNNRIYANFCENSSVVVGLRILTHIPQAKSIVVVNPALKIILSTSIKHHADSDVSSPVPAYRYSCFLKSCYLCNNNLSLDKEVFMYRGDQGFCSIECRGRQIVLDEMSELELSSKQMIRSYRQCTGVSGRRQTHLLVEDRRRRNKSTHRNQNHWAIVS